MKASCARGLLVLSMFLGSAISGRAESYKGIGPFDTLADVKRRLPGATYERLKPAWAQPDDALYSVSGVGLSGTIIIKFEDYRPVFRQKLEAEKDPEIRKQYERLLKESDEEAFTVEWVRWVPDDPIPLQRFISKYGQPEKSGFSDDDLQPYRLWVSKGLAAYLSDGETFVLRVDYEFTPEEMGQAYEAKWGPIPKASN